MTAFKWKGWVNLQESTRERKKKMDMTQQEIAWGERWEKEIGDIQLFKYQHARRQVYHPKSPNI